MKMVFYLILMFFSVLPAPAQVPDWFVKLQNLQEPYSTDKDIERLFNSPKITFSTPEEQVGWDGVLTKVIEYEMPEGELSVFFSAGKCSKKNIYGYDLDDGVILSYKFKSKIPIEISKVKPILKGFKPAFIDDKDYQFLENKKKGVLYTFYQQELIQINYSFPSKYYKSCIK